MPRRTPLTELLLAISDTGDRLNRLGDRLFGPMDEHTDPVSATEYVGQFRHSAADVIVWLEMKGRSEDADEIDDAIASLIEVAGTYDRGELEAWLPDDEQADPVTPIDQLREAVSIAVGRIEDLDDEIPAEVWEGYDDA